MSLARLSLKLPPHLLDEGVINVGQRHHGRFGQLSPFHNIPTHDCLWQLSFFAVPSIQSLLSAFALAQHPRTLLLLAAFAFFAAFRTAAAYRTRPLLAEFAFSQSSRTWSLLAAFASSVFSHTVTFGGGCSCIAGRFLRVRLFAVFSHAVACAVLLHTVACVSFRSFAVFSHGVAFGRVCFRSPPHLHTVRNSTPGIPSHITPLLCN